MKTTRKEFLKTLGAGAVGALTVGSISVNPARAQSQKKEGDLKVGIASYTFREFSLDEAISMTRRLDVGHLALKSMHMPLESSKQEIASMAAKVRNAGIDLYGAGVIYMKSEAEVDNAFEYAKAAGLQVIIGVPNHDLLPLVNKKVNEYEIKVAIHNHGPGDSLYSSPDDVYDKIKDMDTRIGLCLDVGHTFRIGQDPVTMVKKYSDRIYDIHLKDIDKPSAEGANIECGRGAMDIPALLRSLREIHYNGIVALEYEKNGKDPLPGTAESIGYTRGVMDAL